MTDRIQTILKSLNLSPSQFADEIDVQRSSVSHILSGRNKPSLDFVNKILSSFPEISPDWLLFGKGGMHRKSGPVAHEKTDVEKPENKDPLTGEKQTGREIPPPALKKIPSLQKGAPAMLTHHDQEIMEIIIFYRNNTFKVFKPSE